MTLPPKVIVPQSGEKVVNEDGTPTQILTRFFNALVGGQSDLSNTHYLYDNVDANLTAGYTDTAVDDGTWSSGTYTPSPAGANIRTVTNNGAHTLAAPVASNSFTMAVLYTNGASAGTITDSGFTFFDGDLFDTTSGHQFLVSIVKIGSVIYGNVKALQL